MFGLEVSTSLSRLTSQVSDMKYHRVVDEKKLSSKLTFIWIPYVATECDVYRDLPQKQVLSTNWNTLSHVISLNLPQYQLPASQLISVRPSGLDFLPPSIHLYMH